ncbi:MAG: SMP-30/gluconolactonase/LRE family protein [Planctomycetes bacterium]|nr:SMP-30/gluconolactonase/LRE family protein [Planctomycetota bacterium]
MVTQDVPLPAGIVVPGSRIEIATFVAFLEGPAADAEGHVYFSDIRNSRIMRLSPDGTLSVFREDSGRTNGNVFDLEGRLISCEGAEFGGGGRRRMVRTDMRTGKITVLAERYEGKRYNSPNDVTVDSKGRIWFTDPRYGDRSDMEMDIEGVYRIDLDGKVTRVLAQPQIGRPNGIAVTPDARRLYVIDSNPVVGGNRKVWSFAVDPDGRLTNQRVVFDFAPGRGGDGMELDREGNLYVCAGIITPRGPHETDQWSPGVYVITPSGKLLGRIPIPEDLITNCCFGGPDWKTLYVTAGKTLYSIRVNIAGYHAYAPR